MSLDNACRFVAKLRENNDFRLKILATSDSEELVLFLKAEDMIFNQRELVGAMAECMEQLEKRECC